MIFIKNLKVNKFIVNEKLRLNNNGKNFTLTMQ